MTSRTSSDQSRYAGKDMCSGWMAIVTRKLFEGAPDEQRRQGRPQNRWKDGVMTDLLTLQVHDWKSLAAGELIAGDQERCAFVGPG